MDFYLKNETKEEFDQMIVHLGLAQWSVEEIVPTSYQVVIDRIGSITINEVYYPEYYTNVRITCGLTEEQIQTLNLFTVNPGESQYRKWAE